MARRRTRGGPWPEGRAGEAGIVVGVVVVAGFVIPWGWEVRDRLGVRTDLQIAAA